MAPAAKPEAVKKPADPARVQEKFAALREAMNETLIERTEEVDVVLTAMLCGEHPLLVGPPGTAKSFLLDSVLSAFPSASKFNVLFNKFTQPDEVFGPVSLVGLKEDKFRRVIAGKLPEAHFAFGDEISR